MTNTEKQEIIEAVLAALATNSKTIAQLSPKTSLIDSDLFEVAGGSRVTYAVLKELIRDGLALASQLSNYVTGDAAMMYLAKLDTDTGTIDFKESPCVMLDGFKDVNGYTPATGDLFYENRSGYQIWIKTAAGATGEHANTHVVYVNKNDNHIYRWTGTTMQQIGGGDAASVLVDVYVDGTDLVMVFNTTDGEETVRIDISDEFDPSNYYDKSAVDTLLAGKVSTTRKVNNKPLSSDVTLAASDVGAVPTTRTVNGKALSQNINIGINDIDGLAAAIANAGSGAVSVSTNQDGTFTITVGSDSYTINLNHTHPDMAKLVVCEESELPSTLQTDTIYAQVDDSSNPTEIEKLYIAGLEFSAGTPDTSPRLVLPRDSSEIDFDGSSSAPLVVRGQNLTQALTISVTGDLTVTLNGSSVASISASDANSGVSLLITKGSNFSSGTVAFSSNELESRSVSVVDTYVPTLPEGFVANTAWNGANGSGENFSAPGEQTGYCTTPKIKITGSGTGTLYIKAGYVKGVDIPAGMNVFFQYNWGNSNAAYSQNADPRTITMNNGYGTVYNYLSATMKMSEIDDCYIYEVGTGYLWKGKNVPNTPPSI